MALTVSTVAPTRRLTRLEHVKRELELTEETYDALLEALIDQATAALEAYCHRPFAREVYTETLPGYGDIHLALKRVPVITVASVTFDGQAVTDYSIAEREQGTLYRRGGWYWTAQTFGGLGGDGLFLDIGSPLPQREEPLYSVEYTAGYLLPEQNLLGKTTLSAAAADNSFNDSGSGFPALLKAGDVVEVEGFATAGNNGRFQVTGTPTVVKIPVSGSLTLEAAGPAVTIRFREFAGLRPLDGVEKACIETVKAWFSARKDDPRIVEKHLQGAGLRFSEAGLGAALGLPAACIGLLRPWVRAAA